MRQLLDLLQDGEKLTLEYGGRVSLRKFGIVVAISLEAVEKILVERRLAEIAASPAAEGIILTEDGRLSFNASWLMEE